VTGHEVMKVGPGSQALSQRTTQIPSINLVTTQAHPHAKKSIFQAHKNAQSHAASTSAHKENWLP